jgi:DUF1680 family protein
LTARAVKGRNHENAPECRDANDRRCLRGFAKDADHHRLIPVPITHVVVEDDFWLPKMKVWREVTIPDCFTKFENDRGGAINNFDRVRDGLVGSHAGPAWYDGLIYEMIRGSADFLAATPDPNLERRIDGYVEQTAAAAAKDADGYLNTWTQLILDRKPRQPSGTPELRHLRPRPRSALAAANHRRPRCPGDPVVRRAGRRGHCQWSR